MTGDAATAAQVCKAGDSTLIEAKEWAFAETGGMWRVKSAPLPGK